MGPFKGISDLIYGFVQTKGRQSRDRAKCAANDATKQTKSAADDAAEQAKSATNDAAEQTKSADGNKRF